MNLSSDFAMSLGITMALVALGLILLGIVWQCKSMVSALRLVNYRNRVSQARVIPVTIKKVRYLLLASLRSSVGSSIAYVDLEIGTQQRLRFYSPLLLGQTTWEKVTSLEKRLLPGRTIDLLQDDRGPVALRV